MPRAWARTPSRHKVKKVRTFLRQGRPDPYFGSVTGSWRPTPWGLSLAVVCGLGGCYDGLDGFAGADDAQSTPGDEGGGPADPDVPDAPTAEDPPQAVPATLAELPSDNFCMPLGAGQRLAGVSPEGFAWLAEDMPGAAGHVQFAVVDPWTGATTAAPKDLELGAMVDVRPQSSQDAVVVSTDALWHVDEWSRVSLVPPTGFAPGATACGNPRDNGYLLSAGTLHEHREGQWWALAVDAHEGGVPEAILTFDGECTGPGDETWMTAADGTVWRVSTDGIVHAVKFEGFVDAAATGPTLAVLADGELWLGPESWSRWTFDAGTPTVLAASDDHVWIGLGGRVIRFADGEFTELVLPGDATDVADLIGHAGGVWISRDEELCHAAVGPQLRIADAHPYQRTPLKELAFVATAKDAGVTVTATVDGEDLTLSPGGSAGELTGVVTFEGLGWHEVVLRAVGSDGESAERKLWLRHNVPDVVTFSADVAPIAQEHCGGTTCHGAMTTAGIPVLETLEAWVERADTIERRVVELDNMPPVAVRADGWGSDEVETIAKWIEGGMLP